MSVLARNVAPARRQSMRNPVFVYMLPTAFPPPHPFSPDVAADIGDVIKLEIADAPTVSTS